MAIGVVSTVDHGDKISDASAVAIPPSLGSLCGLGGDVAEDAGAAVDAEDPDVPRCAPEHVDDMDTPCNRTAQFIQDQVRLSLLTR